MPINLECFSLDLCSKLTVYTIILNVYNRFLFAIYLEDKSAKFNTSVSWFPDRGSKSTIIFVVFHMALRPRLFPVANFLIRSSYSQCSTYICILRRKNETDFCSNNCWHRSGINWRRWRS